MCGFLITFPATRYLVLIVAVVVVCGQVLCIDAIAIISIWLGTLLFWVVGGILAQGGYLIIDAYRDRNPEK